MWQILFNEDHRGNNRALDYINSLSPRDKVKVSNTLRLLEEFGTALAMPHARHIEGKLWELRPDNNRLFYCLYNGKQFVVLHGFRKKTMQTPEKEIQIALRRMDELLEK
ncbi:MAG: type II toxin-antitoxin system RelE/ParE family toxin [Anaerolineales bacterium]|nr:type II toxin-antitoxin system RelE/ParE family toxin [Anaerolineales bacterium]